MNRFRFAPSLAMPLAALICTSYINHAAADWFGIAGNSFDIEFVKIGNPGNPPDTTGNPNPAGSVPYTYRIGKYEVSRDMVTKANSDGGLQISLADMSGLGGNGVDRPATGVSWNEAARFVNWLNTSQGFIAAYKFTTYPNDGDYDANQDILLWISGDVGFSSANPYRNSLARYFLPSDNEWYKAAYYAPASGVYFNFPTGSDSAPLAVASGTTAGTAVIGQGNNAPADITLAGGPSPYGTVGQGGNVGEWEETAHDLVNDSGLFSRGVRGGSWDESLDFNSNLLSSIRGSTRPTNEPVNIGFRVASTVPEPATASLIAVGVFALARRRYAR